MLIASEVRPVSLAASARLSNTSAYRISNIDEDILRLK